MKTSSSRTDSPIVTDVSWFEYWRTIIFVSSIPSLSPSVCTRRSATRAVGYQQLGFFVQSHCLACPIFFFDKNFSAVASRKDQHAPTFSPSRRNPHPTTAERNIVAKRFHVPICNPSGEVRMTVPRQELYRIARHFVSSQPVFFSRTLLVAVFQEEREEEVAN